MKLCTPANDVIDQHPHPIMLTASANSLSDRMLLEILPKLPSAAIILVFSRPFASNTLRSTYTIAEHEHSIPII